MIRKLQMKFVLITTLATIIITGTIFGIITIENYRSTEKQTDELLNMIVEYNGIIPEYPDYKEKYNDSAFITEETRFSTRYFTVTLDENNEIIKSDMEYIAAVTEEDIESIISTIFQDNDLLGYYNNYKYKIVEYDDYKLIVFLDCTTQLNSIKSTTQKSIFIVLVGNLIVFLVVSLVSKRVLRPIIDSIEKQKQFITNASHELKTPLAVISADIDVLEMTIQDNEWIESIKNQSLRLNTLIKSMLNLANIEEEKSKLQKEEFDISNMISNQIENLKILMQDKNIEYLQENENIITVADKSMIEQLITILLDNARKYTPQNGNIVIRASKLGKNTKVEIENECENAKLINPNKLFDRFYREDKSRNKKQEGYGIGLSIAKSIVDIHSGKISASTNLNTNTICFKFII